MSSSDPFQFEVLSRLYMRLNPLYIDNDKDPWHGQYNDRHVPRMDKLEHTSSLAAGMGRRHCR